MELSKNYLGNKVKCKKIGSKSVVYRSQCSVAKYFSLSCSPDRDSVEPQELNEHIRNKRNKKREKTKLYQDKYMLQGKNSVNTTIYCA